MTAGTRRPQGRRLRRADVATADTTREDTMTTISVAPIPVHSDEPLRIINNQYRGAEAEAKRAKAEADQLERGADQKRGEAARKREDAAQAVAEAADLEAQAKAAMENAAQLRRAEQYHGDIAEGLRAYTSVLAKLSDLPDPTEMEQPTSPHPMVDRPAVDPLTAPLADIAAAQAAAPRAAADVPGALVSTGTGVDTQAMPAAELTGSTP